MVAGVLVVSATPEWVRAFARRQRAALLLATSPAVAMVLGILAAVRLGDGPDPAYWALAAMWPVVIGGVVGYSRWTTSARYCRALPAARRFSGTASFHRCLLIDRPGASGSGLRWLLIDRLMTVGRSAEAKHRWRDRAGVLVLDEDRIILCESGAGLTVSAEMAWPNLESVIVARLWPRPGRFVEFATPAATHRLYCQRAAIEAVQGRASEASSRSGEAD